MATRLYLPSTGTPDITPAFEAGWTENTSADRIDAVIAKGATAMTAVTRAMGTTTGTRLTRQYISPALAAQTIAVGTVKGTVRVNESAVNDNIMQVTCSIRVVDSTGGTYRTPAILAKGQYGPSNEWAKTTNTARRIADGDATASVVCSEGDRIVIELGYYCSVGLTISGDMVFGNDSGTDLGDNETDTAAYNPFIEFYNTLSWKPIYNQLAGSISTDEAVASAQMRMYFNVAGAIATDEAVANANLKNYFKLAGNISTDESVANADAKMYFKLAGNIATDESVANADAKMYFNMAGNIATDESVSSADIAMYFNLASSIATDISIPASDLAMFYRQALAGNVETDIATSGNLHILFDLISSIVTDISVANANLEVFAGGGTAVPLAGDIETDVSISGFLGFIYGLLGSIDTDIDTSGSLTVVPPPTPLAGAISVDSQVTGSMIFYRGQETGPLPARRQLFLTSGKRRRRV